MGNGSHGDPPPPLWTEWLTDRHDWKHYLLATSLSDGKNRFNALEETSNNYNAINNTVSHTLLHVSQHIDSTIERPGTFFGVQLMYELCGVVRVCLLVPTKDHILVSAAPTTRLQCALALHWFLINYLRTRPRLTPSSIFAAKWATSACKKNKRFFSLWG